MHELIPYFINIMPGLLLLTFLFFVVPRRQMLLRIVLLILGFILVRDAMTPAGFWNFGVTGSAFWIRFIDNAAILVFMGVATVAASVLLLRVASLRTLVKWGDVYSWKTYVFGLVVGLCIALLFILLGLQVPIEDRGGAVVLSLLPALFFMAFAGNFLEELLFRGFLQSYLAKQMNSARAAVISGLLFGAAHIFLASTVTSVGWLLLVFVVIEGLACAFVYRKFGLIGATIVHGSVIFLSAAAFL